MSENYLELYNVRSGSSQQTRLDKNLMPGSFLIDGHTTSDLIKFAVKFSEFLIYHDVDTEEVRNWKNFFVHERHVYIYIIAGTNLHPYRKKFYNLLESIYLLTDQKDIEHLLKNLLDPVYELRSMLEEWSTNLRYSDLVEDNSFNFNELINNSDFISNLNRIYSLCLTGDDNSVLLQKWQNEDKSYKFGLNPSDPTKIKGYSRNDLDIFKDTFEYLYRIAESSVIATRELIEKSTDTDQETKPHAALFLGFLKIYKILQDRINSINEKHLLYYYQQVLLIEKHKKRADKTFVQVELKENIQSHLIKKGTRMIGGKDKTGEPIVYETTEDSLLTSTRIKAINSLFVSQNPLNYTGLDSQDVITDIFYNKHNLANQEPWRLFGEDQFFKAVSERNMQSAGVGFIIASDILQMSGGDRVVIIDLVAKSKSYNTFKTMIGQISKKEDGETKEVLSRIFSTAFDIMITLDGNEEKFERCKVTDNPAISGISIELHFSSDDPGIVPIKNIPIPGQPAVKSPYVKVMLRKESHIYAFPIIQILDIINIKIRTEVSDISDLHLFNNYGQVDHSKPFQVFGAVPKLHSYFLIGSSEVFSKPVTNLNIHMNWYQLPDSDEGWKDYFSEYDTEVNNSDYNVRIDYLNSGTWEPIEGKQNQALFEEQSYEGTSLNKLSGETHLTNLVLPLDPSEKMDADNFKPYNSQTRNGYLKLELISPEFGFGFDEYHNNLYKAIRENAKLTEDKDLKGPNPPLSPMLKSVLIDYFAKTEAIDEKGPTGTIELFSLGPFGYKNRPLISTKKPSKLLLNFEPEGHFMIGLDSKPQDGVINLFVRMQLANVESYIRETPPVKWQYLKNNSWFPIPFEAILFDSTMGFIQSGLIKIQIPDAIEINNTLMDPSLYWIRASVEKNSHIAPAVLGLHMNAVRVRWDGKSDGAHLENPKEKVSISKLEENDPAILKIEQVFDSYGGKPVEIKKDYYKRVSERLRHKNRVVNNWDYERLILQHFPFVFKAKCFNAVEYNMSNSKEVDFIEPGTVMVVLTPDISNPHITNKNRPQLGINLLIMVRKYLRERSSPFVNIEVRNPYYERVRVICKVKFVSNANPGHYVSKLNTDIMKHLTPWRYSAELDEQFGNSVYRSKVLSFVNNLDYVDFVTSFSVVKTNTDQKYFKLYDTARKSGNEKEEIKPVFPWSILTSVRQHDLQVIHEEKYLTPEPRGIDNMKLGVDFVITEKE